MQPYPWDLADPRKRPKRIAKKLKARLNWRRHPPKGVSMRAATVLAQYDPLGQMRWYVPTRKGAREAHVYESNLAMSSGLRIIAKDVVGPITVSTVFLCIDHSMNFPPQRGPNARWTLWETMLFHGNLDCCDEDTFIDMGYGIDAVKHLSKAQWRYTSREHAKAHHIALVEMLRFGRT